MKYKFLIIVILIIGIIIRFYRLPDLTSFSYEQALALESAGQMVQTGKISLVGVEYFIRQTSAGHSFFNSAFYLYPISLVQLIFGHDPIYQALLFSLLNIFAGWVLYYLASKYLGKRIGLYTLVIFMFSPTMVDISRTVWHIYLLIPITVLSLFFLFRSYYETKPLNLILLGFFLGLGFGIHISFILGVAIGLALSFYYLFLMRKIKLFGLLLFGVLLGNFPMIIFDLRHNFYNLRTMITFLMETLSNHQSGFSFEYYHFLYLLVPLYLLAAILMKKFFIPKTAGLLLILYVLISYQGFHLGDKYPAGMPKGTSLNIIKKISSIIAADAPGKYEVASIIDGETRAENIRYLLKYVNKKTPMGSDQYPNADILYVVSYTDQEPLTKSVYEIDSLKPAKIDNTWQINDLIKLTKIGRTKTNEK